MATIRIQEEMEVPPPPVVEHPPRIDAPPPAFTLPKFDLPETDEVPMETPWHRWAMIQLMEAVLWHLRDRENFFVGGNMFIYYGARQTATWSYRGPDFFFVDEVDGNRPRRYWLVYEEDGRYPNVIIELISPTTAVEDRTTKKAIYEKTFRTPEYYCYDPDTAQLEGWRHNGKRYQPIKADERGWMWSEELGLWLGTWQGTYQRIDATWPRFFDREGNLVLTRAEAREQQAQAERERAEAERQRAEHAEAEIARLKALLAEKGQAPTSPNESPNPPGDKPA
jgi:Uma2 family endonuclease